MKIIIHLNIEASVIRAKLHSVGACTVHQSLGTNPSTQNQTHPYPTTHRQIADTQILPTQNRSCIAPFTHMSTMQLSRPYHPTPLLLSKHHHHTYSTGFVG